MGERDLDSLNIELEKAKQEAYAQEKAKSEVNAMVDIAQDTNKTLQVKLNSKVAQRIDNDEQVAQRIDETANRLVDKGLKVQDNKATASIMGSEDEIMTADYNKNKEEYLYHGINHKIDKEWKRKLILMENDIWFVIWAIVGFFTIVPVSTFLSRIKALSGLVKWIAIMIGVVMLLICGYALTYWVLESTGVITQG